MFRFRYDMLIGFLDYYCSKIENYQLSLFDIRQSPSQLGWFMAEKNYFHQRKSREFNP